MNPLVVGNWKMHKTAAEAVASIRTLLAADLSSVSADAALCPPFTALAAASEALAGSRIALGAQTMHAHASGAYTGEISPVMLREFGVVYVILGHSERRAYDNETDAAVNAKVRAALAHGMTPLVAVGDTAEEHAAGATIARVVAQTRATFDGIAATDVARCVVAYEPIWAIGTGNVERPDNANATMGQIRTAVDGLAHARILYGGSVKPDNIAELLAQPHIDGALVGGASLDPHAFATLLRNSRKGTFA
jgi:triosephosphate isomerase